MKNRYRAIIKSFGFTKDIESSDLTFIHIDIRIYIWTILAKKIETELINRDNVKISIWDKRNKKHIIIDSKKYYLK